MQRLQYNLGQTIQKNTSEWLYGEWNEDKLHTFQALYSLPVVHQYFDYLLDIRSDNEYLRRYGMDYSDIHDPRKLNSTRSASALASRTFEMVSSNINDLYQ